MPRQILRERHVAFRRLLLEPRSHLFEHVPDAVLRADVRGQLSAPDHERGTGQFTGAQLRAPHEVPCDLRHAVNEFRAKLDRDGVLRPGGREPLRQYPAADTIPRLDDGHAFARARQRARRRKPRGTRTDNQYVIAEAAQRQPLLRGPASVRYCPYLAPAARREGDHPKVRRAGQAQVVPVPVDWAAVVASVAAGAGPAAAVVAAVKDAVARDAVGAVVRYQDAAEVLGVAAVADDASSNSPAHTKVGPRSSAPSNPQY